MATKELDFYLANPAEFESLSDEDKATLFNDGALEQGDTEAAAAAEEISEAPAAETTPELEDPPELLAKDGKHTIPYQELLDAREQARLYEQQAKELAALVENLKQPQAPVNNLNDEALANLRKQEIRAQFDGDEDKVLELREQIDAELARRAEDRALVKMEERIEARIQGAQATDQFENTVETLEEQFPLLNPRSDAGNPQAMQDVRDWRDLYLAKGHPASEALVMAVEKVVPLYNSPSPMANAAPTAAQKAAQVIANTKSKAPVSLSDIPAGSAAHHDEAQAMLNKTPAELATTFHGKTQAQILEIISRVI